MMAMSKAGGVHRADGGHFGAANTCKVSLPSPMSPASPGKSPNSLSLDTRADVMVDPQPRVTLARNAHAVLRGERALERVRLSLCILHI